MQTLFEQLIAAGESGLTTLCAEEAEETLHLEFKTLSDHSGARLTKDDRRLIAKALCGLSNAEGGTLILGIKTEKRDNIDVAKELKLFENCKSLRNRIVAALPDLLSPQHTKIQVEPIAGADGVSGYVIIDVPPSDLRPHMSIAEHRYFRRGSDGTRMMEHGEVRDLMLAPKTGQMGLELKAVPVSALGGNKFQVALECRLINTGKVAIAAPYLQCSDPNLGLIQGAATSFIIPRSGARGRGLYTGRDILLHADDTLTMGAIQAGLYVRNTDGAGAATAVRQSIIFHDYENVVAFHPWTTGQQEHRPGAFSFSFRFGGENVPIQEITWRRSYPDAIMFLAKAFWPDID